MKSEDLKTLLIGITSAAEHQERRDLIRKTFLRDKPTSIDYIFVIAKPPMNSSNGRSKPKASSAAILQKLEQEEKLHKDLLIIDLEETTSYGGGLTFLFFSQVYYHSWPQVSAEKSASMSSSSPSVTRKLPYSFVMKVDDDVWLHLNNLEVRFARMVNQDADKWVYFGRQSERRHFMAGMGYALSRDWVKWLATTVASDETLLNNGGGVGSPEEAVLSSWLHKSGIKVNSINENREIYDYPGFGKGWAHEFTHGTLLIHQVQEDEAFMKTHQHFNKGI